MDCSEQLFRLFAIAILVCTCSVQAQTDAEKGVILTVQSTNQPGRVHLRHLNVFLPYDNVTGSISVPGLRFSTPEMHFLSVEVDYRNKEVFLYDVHFKTVFIGTNYNAPLNLQDSGMTFYAFHVGIGTGAVQLAYDWLSRTLYWTDSVLRLIVAAPGSYEKTSFDYYRYVVRDNLEHPEGIAVDPLAGYMFFSDNGAAPKIERALLDGSGRTNLKIKSLSNPESLEVDIFNQKLYIVDTTRQVILETDYDGNNPRQVRRFTFSTLTDIAIYRETLYVANAATGSLYIVNTTNGLLANSPIRLRSESIYGVSIYSEEVQPLKNNATTNCTDLDCDHICISTATGAKCVCSEGYAFNATANKCEEAEGKFHRALVIASATRICLADIRSLSYFSYSLTCIYTVIPPPTTLPPSTTTTTTATSTTTTTTTTPSTMMTTQKSTLLSSTILTTVPTTIVTHSDHAMNSTTTEKTTVPTQPPSTAASPQTTVPGRRKREVAADPIPGRFKRQAASPPPVPSTAATTPSTQTSDEEIVTFDLDMEERLMFFVVKKQVTNTTSEYRIYERLIDLDINNTVRVEITVPGGIVSGIAYDWVGSTEALYWSESDTGMIYYINVKSRNVRPVMNTTVPSPSELHILAHERKLAFIARPGTNYSIHTVNLDGTGLTPVVIRQNQIRDITIDQDKRIIYWIENGQIFSIDFEGTKEPTVLTSTPAQESDLLILYNNYLVWTQPSDTGNTEIESFIIDRRRTGNTGQIENSGVILELKILDIQLQPPESKYPCALLNGNCEQICLAKLLSNGSYVRECECALGFTLQPDGVSCQAKTVMDEFCLVTDWTNDQIFQIDLQTDSIGVVHVDDGITYFGVFYNKLTRRIVWSEVPSPDVYSSEINGTFRSLLADNDGTGQVEKFALDESTGNLFYTINNYPSTASIGVISKRGAKRRLNLDASFDFGYFFSGIDVHPKRGLLFFTAGSYIDRSYIVRSNMDGSNTVKLEISVQEGSSLPEGLAIDHVNDMLYWADYIQDKIYKCDLTNMVLANPSLVCELFVAKPSADIKDIFTDGLFLYYTAWNAHFVTRVNLSNSEDSKRVGNNLELGRLETVFCYRSSTPNTQQPNTICETRDGRGPCSEFCLPKTTEFTCACNEGVNLQPNQKACEGEFLCDQTFTQVNSNIQISVEDSCLLYVNETCNFACQPGTRPNSENLTCTDSGWDKQSTALCEVIYCPETLPNGKWASTCNRTAGSTCIYECNLGFRETATTVKCGLDGQWAVSVSELCSTEICISGVRNGKVQDGCSLENNAVCSYTCNGGFRPVANAPASLRCNSDGTWSPNPNNLCEAMQCPPTIVRGNISSTCARNIKDVCRYTCVEGSYQAIGLTTLTCLSSGNWDFKGKTPCSDICTSNQFKCVTSHKCIGLNQVCDRTSDCPDGSDEANCTCNPAQLIPAFASLGSDCDLFYDSNCTFGCNRGYRKAVQTLTCQRSNGLWTPNQPCEEIFCPMNFTNGGFNTTCNRKVDTICTYYCGSSLVRSGTVTRVKCLQTGAWNQTNNLCLTPPTVTSGQGGSKKKGANTAGIAVGVIVAVLVILAVVGAAFLFYRRRYGFKKESPYSTASFNNGNNIAIENPGYMTADLRVANDMDEPYINTAMQETPKLGTPMQTVNHHDIDTGISNPMFFNQEPLSAESDISQPTDDNVVLTTDSWLKEKGKGPTDLSNNNQ